MADIVTLTKMAIEALDRKDPALLLSSGLAGHRGDRMGPAIYHVNAFCGRGAAGNPRAVCRLDDSHSTEWMQEVAAQMNLSETGFVQRLDTGDFALLVQPVAGNAALWACHLGSCPRQQRDTSQSRVEKPPMKPEMISPADDLVVPPADRAEIVDALYRFAAGQDLDDRALFESGFSADAYKSARRLF